MLGKTLFPSVEAILETLKEESLTILSQNHVIFDKNKYIDLI